MVPNRSTGAALPCASKGEVSKKTNEPRKTLKPLMEKRRRARINESLEQLKTLILPLVGKDNFRYSKFEKADVLEMTVRFLRHLPSTPVKSPSDSYMQGYKTCLQRVSTVLSKTNLLDKDTRHRLNEYVQQCLTAWEAPACKNCKCGSQNAWVFPQTTLRASRRTTEELGNSRLRADHRKNSTAHVVNRPQPLPQAVSTNVWRPW